MPELLPAILTTGVIIENGGTDAPNSVSAAVASGALSPRKATALAAVCNFIGAVFSGLLFPRVAGTVGELSGLSGAENKTAALTAAMFAVLIWTGAAWLLSVPTSESHGLMAAMGGAAAACGGEAGFSAWAAMIGAAVGSAAGGWLFGKLAHWLIGKTRIGEKKMKSAQIWLAGASSVLHGAQDGQKFMCVLTMAAAAPGNGEIPWTVVLWCGGVLALGTALCGKRLLGLAGSLGVENSRQGLGAEIGGSAVLLLATLAGVPVSTTHVKTASAAGAGKSGQSQKRTFLGLAAAWALTFPVCAGLGWLFAGAAEYLFQLA
ncbi:MAG: inorganic phosphate transporter [Clostridia bacterium]|nr:inorganic phosphate transporter [Clostridia bacterium]